MAASDPRSGKLRVLMVAQRLLPYLAGAEVQALGLAASLQHHGVSVRFLSTQYVAGLARSEEYRSIHIDRVPVLRGPLLKATQLAAAAAWVARHADAFDLVHAHCLSATALGAAIGGAMRGLPVLVKPSLGGADGEMAKLAESPAWPAVRRVLGNVDRFAALDEGIEQELRSAGVAESAIARVDNGIDLEIFRPADASEKMALRRRLGLPEGPIVLYAGQLVDRKGILETLEAWRNVAGAFGDAHLLVAGSGDRAPAVLAAAAEEGARIRYLGVLEGIADVLRASDVFILPSRNESFGNAILEAMACGLPVVVGRTGIAARLEIARTAGAVLDDPHPRAIADALCRILGAPDRGRALGMNGRAMAEPFAFERVTQRYLEIYRSMLHRRA